MSNNTRMMADAIAQGIAETDPRVAVKIFNVARSDKNEILTNVFRSKGVLVGTSTMNNVMMPKIAGLKNSRPVLPWRALYGPLLQKRKSTPGFLRGRRK